MITCATGRYLHEVMPVAAALGLTRHAWIFEGGTRTGSPNGETLWERALNPDAPAKILEICRELSPTSTVVSSWNYRHLPVRGTTLPPALRLVYLVYMTDTVAAQVCPAIHPLASLA